MHKAVQFEEGRKRLLAQKKYAQVLKTYQTQKVFLPDENTGGFWDDIFAQQPGVFPMESWRIHKVASLIDYRKSILNLGVGRGDLEALFLQHTDHLSYLGTDITPQTIAHLKKKFPTLQFKQTDLLGLSPTKYQFDQILLLEVLEHIKPSETFAVLQHIYKLLPQTGTFMVSVPVNEGLEKMLPINPNSHMRLYSEELLRFELKSVGFKVKEVYRASAFQTFFEIKQMLNLLTHHWQPNNLLMVCEK